MKKTKQDKTKAALCETGSSVSFILFTLCVKTDLLIDPTLIQTLIQ